MSRDRVRRYRQRKAEGEIVLTIVVPEVETIDELVRSKWLVPSDQDDRDKIAAAAARAWHHIVTRYSGDTDEGV